MSRMVFFLIKQFVSHSMYLLNEVSFTFNIKRYSKLGTLSIQVISFKSLSRPIASTVEVQFKRFDI